MKKILLSSVCLAMLAVGANAAHYARVNLGISSIDSNLVYYGERVDADVVINFGIDVKKYKESQDENPIVYGAELNLDGRTFDMVNLWGEKTNSITYYQFDMAALGGYGLYLPLGGASLSLDVLGGLGFTTVGWSFDKETLLHKDGSESQFFVKAGVSALASFGKKDNGISVLAEGFLKHTFLNDEIKKLNDKATTIELKAGGYYNIKSAFAGVTVGTKQLYMSKKDLSPYVTFTAGYRF